MDWITGTSLGALVLLVSVSSLKRFNRAFLALVTTILLAFVAVSAAPVALGSASVVFVSVGLMVLAGALKRSGLAAWLALSAAKFARGRPRLILVLLATFTFLFAALLGPVAAVILIVPVALLLATELDLEVLPFVLTLSWAALLGGASIMSAQPSNLWLASTLGLHGGLWAQRILPWTLSLLLVSILLALLVFHRSLRVTHERRARVLEYDVSRSLGARKTLALVTLAVITTVAGLIAGPFLSIQPWVAVWAGVAILWLGEGSLSISRGLAEVDFVPFVALFGLFVAAGCVLGTNSVAGFQQFIPHDQLSLLWLTAVSSSFLDPQAVVAGWSPLLLAWAGPSSPWVPVVLGSTLGGGITIWGVSSSTTALGLAGTGRRSLGSADYAKKGLIFGIVNLAWISFMCSSLPLS